MRSGYVCIGLVFLFSCTEDANQHVPEIPAAELKKHLIEVNKEVTQLESNQIDAYVKRRSLNVVKTETGLRYEIYNDVEGPLIREGQKAVVNYKVSLIDGTECYNTNDTSEVFVVGKDNVESGLHEGITYLSKGDQAIIVIPSHLAHGLAGDFKKIPIRSTIIYDIELVDIQ
ncbi:MAG: FKBP-type peptidyl-prolyl cis-trans isomerase [Flavobacteriales bacterium]|nr:FKBP-type peptidyl-prolyl cis-trans isomerase [Flavobacteriales bacterium]